MGKDMASVDAPSGFSVYGECLRERLYAVNTEPVIGFYVGDCVMHGGSAVATKFGTIPILEDGAVVDGVANTQKLVGVVTACFDEYMDPVKYIAATEAGDGTVAGFVLVADHPMQLFMCQEDGTTNAIDLDDVGQNVDIVSATNNEGNANTGLSTQELASNTVAATAALDVKLQFPHPDDTVGNDTNCHARWIVSINTHFYDSFNAGL
jgi:hypothetical protein